MRLQVFHPTLGVIKGILVHKVLTSLFAAIIIIMAFTPLGIESWVAIAKAHTEHRIHLKN